MQKLDTVYISGIIFSSKLTDFSSSQNAESATFLQKWFRSKCRALSSMLRLWQGLGICKKVQVVQVDLHFLKAGN